MLSASPDHIFQINNFRLGRKLFVMRTASPDLLFELKSFRENRKTFDMLRDLQSRFFFHSKSSEKTEHLSLCWVPVTATYFETKSFLRKPKTTRHADCDSRPFISNQKFPRRAKTICHAECQFLSLVWKKLREDWKLFTMLSASRHGNMFQLKNFREDRKLFAIAPDSYLK